MRPSLLGVAPLLIATIVAGGCSSPNNVTGAGGPPLDRRGRNLIVGESAPSMLGYPLNPAIFRLGTKIDSLEPYFEGGTPTEFSVSPDLPEGLTLSSTTGVVSGTPSALAPSSDFVVVARNSAGSTQTTLTIKISSAAPFVTNGLVRTVLPTDRALYVAGLFTQIGPPTGSGVMLDVAKGGKPGFAAWPPVNGLVRAVVADPANPGGYYIGGDFTGIGNAAFNRIARILPDGRPDAKWNPNIDCQLISLCEVDSVAVSGESVYAGGYFDSVGGQARRGLAAIDAKTGVLTDWDPQASGFVYALAVSDGIVYAGGLFATIGGEVRHYLAAVDASTGLATDWNPNPTGFEGAAVLTIAVSGKTVYVGGRFDFISGQSRYNIAAVDASSGLATDWDPSADYDVNSLAVSENIIYAGGRFNFIGGQPRTGIAALDDTTGRATEWNPQARGAVFSIAVSGSTVYAGGTFTDIGGEARNYLGALDATTGRATSWNPNANSFASALALSGSTLYAGGAFGSLGGQLRNGLAALDASTGLIADWDPAPDGYGNVYSVAAIDNTVYVAGQFTIIGGQPRNSIAAVDATTGLATDWNASPNAPVRLLTPSGDTLYAAGEFSFIGGQLRSGLAALDTATGLATDWNPNPNRSVFALAADENIVYAGGLFTSIGGEQRNGIAALDASTGRATEWNPDADDGIDFLVASLAVSGDTVYAGGVFRRIGGELRSNIAALDATTGLATDWNPGSNAAVGSLVVSGEVVYAAGNFVSIGGQQRYFVAALDANTGLATAWNPEPNWGVSFVVLSLALAGDTLYAGGFFRDIGGELRPNLAVFPAGSDRAD